MDSSTFIGKNLSVEIDRPIGFVDPKYNYPYTLNYGFVPNTISGDGEEVDVYVLGEDKPIKHFEGKCIAVVRRLDDDDDKLIVTKEGNDFSNEEIEKLTFFKEQWFKHIIIR